VASGRKTGDERRRTESLLAHLRKNGTRKGACGSAGIGLVELEERMEADPAFAKAVDEAECVGMAADEQRLATEVEDGDRQCLLFRLRQAYQSGKNGKRAGVKKSNESTAGQYEKIVCKFGELPEEERRKMVEKLRGDPAPAGAVA